jgi:hypothetical protein
VIVARSSELGILGDHLSESSATATRRDRTRQSAPMCGRSSATHNECQSVFTPKSTSGPETNRASVGLAPECPDSFMRAEQPPPCCLRAVGAGNLQVSGYNLAVSRACAPVWISLVHLAAPTSVAIGGNQLPS